MNKKFRVAKEVERSKRAPETEVSKEEKKDEAHEKEFPGDESWKDTALLWRSFSTIRQRIDNVSEREITTPTDSL